jgi:CheY-like chemotaxis protein
MPVPHAASLLIVDDDPDIRDALQLYLAGEGYTTEGVANGREALDYLRGGIAPPSLILLDLKMPVMDGWQFLRERAADPAVADIPVVVVTAEKATDPAGLGVADVLYKPVDVDTLLDKVGRHC